eukprot:1698365-Amphidinium_carterae.1
MEYLYMSWHERKWMEGTASVGFRVWFDNEVVEFPYSKGDAVRPQAKKVLCDYILSATRSSFESAYRM